LNPSDRDHHSALEHSQGQTQGLVTTTWVLVEFADAFCAIASRGRAARFIRGLRAEPYIEVIPLTRDQFDRALDLYERRADKDWSLTDCLSFLVMDDRGIRDALTADHHFEQAGFRALMRMPPA
jgi:predicted nucleic acid-binding protein